MRSHSTGMLVESRLSDRSKLFFALRAVLGDSFDQYVEFHRLFYNIVGRVNGFRTFSGRRDDHDRYIAEHPIATARVHELPAIHHGHHEIEKNDTWPINAL